MTQDKFTGAEMLEFIETSLLLKPLAEVKRLCGVYSVEYSPTTDKGRLMIIDGPSHFWKIKWTTGLVVARDAVACQKT